MLPFFFVDLARGRLGSANIAAFDYLATLGGDDLVSGDDFGQLVRGLVPRERSRCLTRSGLVNSKPFQAAINHRILTCNAIPGTERR